MSEETQYKAVKHKVLEDLKREFKPEFLNRVDDTIIFQPLDKKAMSRILDIMLTDLQKRISAKNITLSYNENVKSYLVDKGYDPKMGARPLRRSIQEHFEDVLSEALLSQGVMNNVSAVATVKKEKKQSSLSFKITKIKKTSLSSTSKKTPIPPKQLSSTA